MGLLPIEFTDCLTDSPYFRENLHAHEKVLDQTASQIKQLIREVKDLISAARTLSRAQRNLANSLNNFSFECIGGSQTDDESYIARSLKEFGKCLNLIEDERDRMLEQAQATFIDPIEKFRREQIGSVKEEKKKFEKETSRFCQSLERHLNLSTRKSESHLQEADASLGMEQRYFMKASLEYVLKLQEVQERKKFEFVETILSFMYGWLTFYHQSYEVAQEFKQFGVELQIRLQRTRENYTATQDEAENLMKKMLEDKSSRNIDPGSLNKMYTRQGYLYLMEKKAFGTTWVKTFCQYQKENRRFIMIPYNQMLGKITTTELITLKECIRRMSDSIEKRFCFDVVSDNQITYTLQALSDEDRKLWLEAMEAISNKNKLSSNQSIGGNLVGPPGMREDYVLDEFGLQFVKKLIEQIEIHGLEDQGIYRVSGVSSKIQRLMKLYSDTHKTLLMNPDNFIKDTNYGESVLCPNKIMSAISTLMNEFAGTELKNMTSALKNYLRNLPEPLMTFRLHSGFISAAKIENKEQRINAVHELVYRLPKLNFNLAHILMKHLTQVAAHSEKNLMNVCNIGVCFGPTLLRPEEESVAAIMNIKFCNVVVEILIQNCDKIFTTKPSGADVFVRPSNRNPSISSLSSTNLIQVPPNHGLPLSAPNVNQTVQSSMAFGVLNRPVSSLSSSVGTIVSGQPVAHNTQNTYREVIRTNPRFTGYPVNQASSTSVVPLSMPVSKPVASYAAYSGPLNKSSHSPDSQKTLQNMPLRSKNQHNCFATPSYPPPSLASSVVSTPTPLSSHLPQSVSVASQYSNTNNSHSSNFYVPFAQSVVASSCPSLSKAQPSVSSSPNSSSSSVSAQLVQPQTKLSGSLPLANAFNNSLTPSVSSVGSVQPPGRSVRTLFACVGKGSQELSFEANVIITNVRQSQEPGWLEGVYNGKIGLIPDNYVEYVD